VVLVVEAEPALPATIEEVGLVEGRKLRTLRGTLEMLREVVDEVGDDYLRIEVEDSGRVGLNDEVREWFPNAVEVRLILPRGGEKNRSIGRVGREPGELFREYLKLQNVDDRRLVSLFDELAAEAVEVDS
jgi:exonuclease SbcD